jgi:hypothetical protein
MLEKMDKGLTCTKINDHIFSGKYNANRTNPMMASKPSRNINSSPTNLSPSRVALRNASGRYHSRFFVRVGHETTYASRLSWVING